MKKLSLEQHEFDVIREIMAERLLSLREMIEKNGDKLDQYERDIRNYTTYDIHCKLMEVKCCLLYTSPSPRDLSTSRMPSSA